MEGNTSNNFKPSPPRSFLKSFLLFVFVVKNQDGKKSGRGGREAAPWRPSPSEQLLCDILTSILQEGNLQFISLFDFKLSKREILHLKNKKTMLWIFGAHFWLRSRPDYFLLLFSFISWKHQDFFFHHIIFFYWKSEPNKYGFLKNVIEFLYFNPSGRGDRKGVLRSDRHLRRKAFKAKNKRQTVFFLS